MTSILFDLDGTLVDSSQGIFKAFNHSFRQLGLPELANQDMISFVGPPLEVTFASLCQDQEEIAKAIEHFRDYYNQFGVHQVEVYPHIPELLQGLIDKGHKLYVTTSKHESMAKLMLQEQGLATFFNNIYGSIENRYHKIDVIKACLKTEKIPLEQATIVGDTKFDMIGGQEAGIKTIGVTWGFGTENQLRLAGANAIYHHPLEILHDL